jgi:hypothetical protein
VKSIMITLDVDIPETELGKSATVTIEGRSYTGTVRIIVIHEAEAEPSAVTLQAPGLTVKTT